MPRAPSPSHRKPVAPAAPTPSDERFDLGSVGIDEDVRAILEKEGIRSLYPPQHAALGPTLRGENVLLACPTASGKSLVAYLALIRAYRAGRRGLYMVPLRALAREKAEELRAFESLGLRVGVSIGDYDLRADQLDRIDVLVATSEKADALLRRGSPWLDRLGVVVADEVHLMRDPDRGPTLEITLTRLRRAFPDLQVVALSATVGNTEAVAEWLRATPISSDFRPVPLRSGVYTDGRILFTDLTTRPVPGPGDPLSRLVRTAIEAGGQALVFVSTRRSSEQSAESLISTVRPLLSEDDRRKAREAAETLHAVAEEETAGIRRLSGLLPHGVAFHNASLTNAEREVVERSFRYGILKALVATPTLAAGINLPARRVVVRDTYRYDDRLGMQAPIPAVEIQQMCGRAGRPRYDREGEAVLIAKDAAQEERFLDVYLSSPPEDIESRLASEPALRMHLLALIASGAVASEDELASFLGATFYGRTLPMSDLAYRTQAVRGFLEENGFLGVGAPLRATPFGQLTSDLYLDPLSALVLRQMIERAPINPGPFALLAGIASTPDLPPFFLKRGEEAEMLERLDRESEELLIKPEEPPMDLGLDAYLATLKTAAVLESWVAERPILEITEAYGIGAGDLRAKVEDAEWLLFGASRIAGLVHRRLIRPMDDLSLRVRYGVKEELLDLVRLRGIGRARARALFRAGYADRESLRHAPADRLEQALRSPRLVESVLAQMKSPSRAEYVKAKGPEPPPPPRPARGRRSSRTLEEYPALEEP